MSAVMEDMVEDGDNASSVVGLCGKIDQELCTSCFAVNCVTNEPFDWPAL